MLDETIGCEMTQEKSVRRKIEKQTERVKRRKAVKKIRRHRQIINENVEENEKKTIK